MLVDILRDHRGGRVVQEGAWRDFRPDIAIYPPDADDPSCVIEVTDTSPPTERKLRAYREHGVDCYGTKARPNPREAIDSPLIVEPLVTSMCGQKQRARLDEICVYLARQRRPYFGIRTTPTGSLEYQYGGAQSDLIADLDTADVSAVVLPLPNEPLWLSLPKICPDTKRSVDRDTFLALAMHSKASIYMTGRITRVQDLQLRHIDDVLALEDGGRASKSTMWTDQNSND